MDYENQLRELENIIQNLESGEIGFDEAIKMFERGAEICKNLSNLKKYFGKIFTGGCGRGLGRRRWEGREDER